jgi:hypothetical protein
MYSLTKPPQDDDLRLSPGLLFSGLKLHKLHSVQVNSRQRIVDRIRQLSHVSRFVTQELGEGAQMFQVQATGPSGGSSEVGEKKRAKIE